MNLIYNNSERKHLDVILSFASPADELVIASPFCFPDFSGFASELSKTGSVKKIVFITTLKPEEAYRKVVSLISFKDEMMDVGIKARILIDNSLHGKVYIFKKEGNPFSAIITSANLTKNGMISNHEWGYQIDDFDEIVSLERQLLDDAKSEIRSEALKILHERIKAKPETIAPKPETIELDDVLLGSQIPYNKRFFVKPVGVTEEPIYGGDFSNEERQYFSRRPKAVRIGDLLIAYGVGSRKIISVFEVISDAISTGNPDDRWKWYVNVRNLTPNMGKNWMNRNLYVMSIAAHYYEKYSLRVTANGNTNLNGLKRKNDKIRLTDGFGRYLYSKVVMEDSIK